MDRCRNLLISFVLNGSFAGADNIYEPELRHPGKFSLNDFPSKLRLTQSETRLPGSTCTQLPPFRRPRPRRVGHEQIYRIWLASPRSVDGLPFFEDVAIGELGGAALSTTLFQREPDGGWRMLRSGGGLARWLDDYGDGHL